MSHKITFSSNEILRATLIVPIIWILCHNPCLHMTFDGMLSFVIIKRAALMETFATKFAFKWFFTWMGPDVFF